MAELNARANLPKPDTYDYKLWAKKIMANPDRTYQQEKYAMDALGVKA
jgi:hypothetical protein